MFREDGAFRVTTAFWRVIKEATGHHAKVVLINLGCNLDAINRAALVAASHVALLVSPALFSRAENFGPAPAQWCNIRHEALGERPHTQSVRRRPVR